MAITRLPDGISDRAASDPLAQLEMLDPTKYAVFIEDFVDGDFVADMDGVVSGRGWTQTMGAELDLDVGLSGATGALTLTAEGGDNEGGQTYLNNATFNLTSGKKAFLETKLNIDAGALGTIGAQELFVGLAAKVTGTNFIDAGGTSLDANECWGFVSLAEEAGIDVEIHDNDTDSVTTDVGTLVDETNIVLSLYYDGTQTEIYVDGVHKGSITGTHPTGDAMTVMIHFKSDEAIAAVLSVDYVVVAVER